ncbi:MAG: hypothetical protein AB8B71_12425 [Paracoccaceae bacterium]
MRVWTLTTLAFVAALPAMAASKAEIERQCQFQADVMGAVQQARLDRVPKRDVASTIRAANPDWSDSLDVALTPVVDFVYGIKRRDLRNVNLAGDTKAACVQNWDQLQALTNAVKN